MDATATTRDTQLEAYGKARKNFKPQEIRILQVMRDSSLAEFSPWDVFRRISRGEDAMEVPITSIRRAFTDMSNMKPCPVYQAGSRPAGPYRQTCMHYRISPAGRDMLKRIGK